MGETEMGPYRQSMSDMNPSPLRRLANRFGGALRIVAVVVGLGFAVVGLSHRTAGSTPSPSPSPVAAVAAGSTAPTADPSTSPSDR